MRTVKNILCTTMLLVVITAVSCKTHYWGFHFKRNNDVVVKIGTSKVIIRNIPNRFIRDSCIMVIGHECNVIIPYPDSSMLYFAENKYESPNNERIRQLNTIESMWRCGAKHWSGLQEELSDTLNPLYHALMREKEFTYGDFFNYTVPAVENFKESDGRALWRDASYNGMSIGYILLDTTRVKEFDNCVEKTISRWTNNKWFFNTNK